MDNCSSAWSDTFLTTNFGQPDIEEQIKDAKENASRNVLHIHYGCDYIGIGFLGKRGSMGCFSCYEKQHSNGDYLNIKVESESALFSEYAENMKNRSEKQIAYTVAARLMELQEENAYIIRGKSLSVEKINIQGNEVCKCCGTGRDNNI